MYYLNPQRKAIEDSTYFEIIMLNGTVKSYVSVTPT